MSKNYKGLYRVTFLRQDNGNEQEDYVLAPTMNDIESTYADIVKVEPINYEELPE